MTQDEYMRPLERRVLDMRQAGLDDAEIGRRFRRSPEHIGRIAEMAELPGRSGTSSVRGGLRAIERRVLRWRSQGTDHAEIARLFKRSPDHIKRVEGLALYKRSLDLLRAASPGS